MITSTGRKIYLSQERGLFENSFIRRYATFNYKEPFHPLFFLNDEMLAANHSLKFHVAKSSYQLLIPLRGELTVRKSNQTWNADVEEIAIIYCKEGESLDVVNEYEAEWLNYIHVGLDLPFISGLSEFRKLSFSFANKGFVEFLPESQRQEPFKISIGLFDGRQEAFYHLQKGSTAFCFVLNGAFEVSGCLLHDRDGLALWNVQEIDIEALSNHAILFLLELNR
jgi:quercetin 2,3-dioxygenase